MEGDEEGYGGQMMMDRDLTWDGDDTIQRTDDVQQNCAPKTCIILLTSVTPINSDKTLLWKNSKYSKNVKLT